MTPKRRKRHHESMTNVYVRVGIGLGALLFLGATAYYYAIKHKSTDYIPLKEPLSIYSRELYRPLSCEDLNFSVNYKDPNTSPKQRISAVKKNLSAVMGITKYGGGVPVGSALMINEGGYFLTVAHNVSEAVDPAHYLFLMVLASQKSYVAREMLLDERRDIAIVHAPTGQPYKPISGIEFRSTPVQKGEKLRMFPVHFPVPDPKYAILERKGTVIEVDATDKPFQHYEKQLMIEGMIPFGGSSGGSVVDNDIKIVGVESGAYSEGSDIYTGDIPQEEFLEKVHKYRGAFVTPTEALPNLFKQCVIHPLTK